MILMATEFGSYVTQHYDNARTGWNPHENILTVANVKQQFGQLFQQQVDGTVYAQPLYVRDVIIPGKGVHNVVFVATENDTVYAFDADTYQPPLWQRSLVPAGEAVVADSDIEGCDNIKPVIGITSTPVIDYATYTMYVVAKTKRVQGSLTTFHYRLYAIDITTGADRHGSPVEIAGSVAGSAKPNDGHGHVTFDPHWHLNRPALLLSRGVIYIGFGSHCDAHIGEYHGWVFAYNASSLAQIGVFSSSPDKPVLWLIPPASGIWQSGMGLAADPDGFIYFTTGNGDFNANNPSGRNYGDTVLKLQPNLAVASYFTPADQFELLIFDGDLGSGGVLVLPDQPATTRFPYLLVTCGKDGDIFLLSRQNLGGYTGLSGFIGQFRFLLMLTFRFLLRLIHRENNPQAVQTLPLQPGRPKYRIPGVWGGPAYYRGPNAQFVYYCGNGGRLKAFLLQNGLLSPATLGGGQPNQSADDFPGVGGTTPNVSSNQQAPGTGVVWAIARQNPIRLRAFDTTNLTVKLFDEVAGPWNNPHGGAFIEPTVINGKVYVGSDGLLTVFGLLRNMSINVQKIDTQT